MTAESTGRARRPDLHYIDEIKDETTIFYAPLESFMILE